VRTPVIVHDYGLLAHLVGRHGQGVTVGCNDSRVLPRALIALTTDADVIERYGPALSGFAVRFSRQRFEEAVSKRFLGDANAAVEQRPPPTSRLHTPQA
jgi:hypothetical protein